MQDISRFFDRNSKERDLSNTSNEDETSKKRREGSLNTSASSDIPDDLFTESLKDPDCVAILLNIKKMEKQITQISDNTKKLKEKQIKSKSHLREQDHSVDFITKKFEKYKQERKEREEIINNLTENVVNQHKRLMSSQKFWKNKSSNVQGATACYFMEFPKRNKKSLMSCVSKQ